MIVKNPQFVLSAVSPAQYPDCDLLEVAFAGRSNVGKSSLINALLGRKNLARHGAKQGMTRQINFYNIDDELHFVDLPGYGYAAVSKEMKASWGKIITNYLDVREHLFVLVLLLDIRHKPTADDIQMNKWMKQSGIHCLYAATKSDKIPKSLVSQNIELIRKTLELSGEDKVIPVSVLKKTGIDKLWEEIDYFIQE